MLSVGAEHLPLDLRDGITKTRHICEMFLLRRGDDEMTRDRIASNASIPSENTKLENNPSSSGGFVRKSEFFSFISMLPKLAEARKKKP